MLAASSEPVRPEAFLSNIAATAEQHYSQGRIQDAIARLEAGLALVLAMAEWRDRIAVGTLADLHARLAKALFARGDLGAAAENYKAALRLVPGLTGCWCNLGSTSLKMGKPQEAIAQYLEALKLTPNHWPSRTNLVQALIATKEHATAKLLLLEHAAERPEDGKIHHELGKVCFELNEIEQAVEHFEQAFALNPSDAEALNWIGSIRHTLGDLDAARRAYLAAAQIQPLITRPAAKSPADFHVLALYAPFGGNTPTRFLFKDAPYQTDTLALLSSAEIDRNLSGHDFDVVLNLISDADLSMDILPVAANLARRLGKPLVNDPDKIARTTRDATFELLQGMAGCRVPRTIRLKAGADRSASALEAVLSFPFPLLARPVGTHGGDDFEKIDDIAALEAFLSQRPGTDHYLIEYLDYRSADGYFRKYRFIFVGEKIFPYHLGVGKHWKLHRDTTDMGEHVWMQQEEETFVRDPAKFFDERNMQVLQMIRDRIGLDYFGIDCALDTSGDLVVFEVNASMLVHNENGPFAYKDSFVHRIKIAFDAMLGRLAKGSKD